MLPSDVMHASMRTYGVAVRSLFFSGCMFKCGVLLFSLWKDAGVFVLLSSGEKLKPGWIGVCCVTVSVGRGERGGGMANLWTEDAL
jgi:hypothetical protein